MRREPPRDSPVAGLPDAPRRRRTAAAELRLAKLLWTLVALPLAAPGCRGGVTPIRTAFNRGVAQQSRGDLDAAIAEYRLALDEEPEDYRARFNLAVALEARASELERSGEAASLREAAEAAYRAVLDARPENARAIVNLAAMEYERGARETALARLRGLIDERPDLALPRVALAARLLQRSSEAKESDEHGAELVHEARELLEAAVDREPASIEAGMLLGETHARLARAAAPPERDGHLARARKAYRRVLKRRPDDLATLVAFGRLEAELGSPEEAIPWYRRVLLVDPDHRGAHRALADLLDAEGELESATRHLWRARELEGSALAPERREEYRRRLLDLYRRLAEQEGER